MPPQAQRLIQSYEISLLLYLKFGGKAGRGRHDMKLSLFQHNANLRRECVVTIPMTWVNYPSLLPKGIAPASLAR